MTQETGNAVEHDTELSITDMAEQLHDEMESADDSEVAEGAAEIEANEAEQAEEQPTDETPELQFPEAPEQWNASLKSAFEAFKELGEPGIAAAQAMAEAHGNMYKDYQKDKQALKGVSTLRDELNGIMDQNPETQYLTESQRNEHVKGVMALANELTRNPLDVLAHLSRSYDPQKVIDHIAKVNNLTVPGGASDEYRDPVLDQELTQRDQRIAQLEQQLGLISNQFQTNQQAQQDQVIQAKVQEFETAVNENGTLKHPHFKDPQVQSYMAMFGNEANQRGEQISPESAYDLACKALGKDAPKATPKPMPKRARSAAPVASKPNQTMHQMADELYDEFANK